MPSNRVSTGPVAGTFGIADRSEAAILVDKTEIVGVPIDPEADRCAGFVEESNVTVNISLLRMALGDTGDGDVLIQTCLERATG
jgi:hypothetical protein